MARERQINGRISISDVDFGARFTMLPPITHSGITTRRGIDEDGSSVMIHFVGDDPCMPGDVPFDMERLVSAHRECIREILEVDGYLVVVTDDLESFTSFEDWVRSGPAEPEEAGGLTADTGTSPGMYTRMFRGPEPPTPAQPSRSSEPPGSTEAFRPPEQSRSPEAPPPAEPRASSPPERAPDMEPGIYTRVMRSSEWKASEPVDPPRAPDAIPPRLESRLPPPPPPPSGGSGISTPIMRSARSPDEASQPGPYTRFMKGLGSGPGSPPPPPPDSGPRPPTPGPGAHGGGSETIGLGSDDYLSRLRGDGEAAEGTTPPAPDPRPPPPPLSPPPSAGPSEYTMFVKGGWMPGAPAPPVPEPTRPSRPRDADVPADAPRPPGPSRTPIVIGLVVSVLALAAVLVFLAIRAG